MEPSSAPWRAIESTQPAEPPPEPKVSPPWPVIAAGVLAVAVAMAAVFVITRPSSGVVVDWAGAPALAAGASPDTPWSPAASQAPELVIEVAGAVRRPGVYHLEAGSRVGDAISAAGGFGPRVDVLLADRQLNLAAPVHDGDEIRVPVLGETPDEASAPQGSPGAAGTGGPVDLNRATAEELDTLPGVGPATAAKIIAAREERPFATLDELVARKVLGTAALAKIRPLATAGP